MASEADSIEQDSSTRKGERDEAQKYSKNKENGNADTLKEE